MMRTHRKLALMVLSTILLGSFSAGCGQNRGPAGSSDDAGSSSGSAKNTKIKMTIGTKTFSVTLFDNPTTDAFKAMLPLTLGMDELNGNEKKYDFAKALPSDASNPKPSRPAT